MHYPFVLFVLLSRQFFSPRKDFHEGKDTKVRRGERPATPFVLFVTFVVQSPFGCGCAALGPSW